MIITNDLRLRLQGEYIVNETGSKGEYYTFITFKNIQIFSFIFFIIMQLH